MEENKSKKGYVLGEAVRDKRSGQKMYVDTTWDDKVPCVYFDSEKGTFVKEEVSFDDLEKIKETVRQIHVSKYMRIVEYEFG
ncbi:hypothetical protein [Leptospira mayottensis]|uniref:hypothetical protein n=1 Tax=Leptospira mayottensis TaxID=1137606 RepID=UPI0014386195|nr:hypothetical protein [Leptospira mayottensis]